MRRTGPLAYGKGLAAAKVLQAEAEQYIGPTADNRHRYGLCACHNGYGDPMLPGQV